MHALCHAELSAATACRHSLRGKPSDYLRWREQRLPDDYPAECKAGGSENFYGLPFIESLRNETRAVCQEQEQVCSWKQAAAARGPPPAGSGLNCRK